MPEPKEKNPTSELTLEQRYSDTKQARETIKTNNNQTFLNIRSQAESLVQGAKYASWAVDSREAINALEIQLSKAEDKEWEQYLIEIIERSRRIKEPGNAIMVGIEDSKGVHIKFGDGNQDGISFKSSMFASGHISNLETKVIFSFGPEFPTDMKLSYPNFSVPMEDKLKVTIAMINAIEHLINTLDQT